MFPALDDLPVFEAEGNDFGQLGKERRAALKAAEATMSSSEPELQNAALLKLQEARNAVQQEKQMELQIDNAIDALANFILSSSDPILSSSDPTRKLWEYGNEKKEKLEQDLGACHR